MVESGDGYTSIHRHFTGISPDRPLPDTIPDFREKANIARGLPGLSRVTPDDPGESMMPDSVGQIS